MHQFKKKLFKVFDLCTYTPGHTDIHIYFDVSWLRMHDLVLMTLVHLIKHLGCHSEVRSRRSEPALKKRIACNLREAPDEKRLPNRRLQRSVLVVYVSGSDCVAWAADSSILPLVLLLSPAYISGVGGKTCALLSFVYLRRFLL